MEKIILSSVSFYFIILATEGEYSAGIKLELPKRFYDNILGYHL
jgi:hypothetical protein